jgi:16S rRNA processing protein RimM
MSPEKPDYLVIGQITAPRGIRGEVKVQVLTDFPERFSQTDRVLLGPTHEPYYIERARPFKQWMLLKFEGLDDRDAVESLRGLTISVPIDEAVPLEQGEYYEYQLLGLEVWTEDDERLGTLKEIIFTGGADVYVIAQDGRERLLPAIEDVVLDIDLEQERIRVRLLEGL